MKEDFGCFSRLVKRELKRIHKDRCRERLNEGSSRRHFFSEDLIYQHQSIPPVSAPRISPVKVVIVEKEKRLQEIDLLLFMQLSTQKALFRRCRRSGLRTGAVHGSGRLPSSTKEKPGANEEKSLHQVPCFHPY